MAAHRQSDRHPTPAVAPTAVHAVYFAESNRTRDERNAAHRDVAKAIAEMM